MTTLIDSCRAVMTALHLDRLAFEIRAQHRAFAAAHVSAQAGRLLVCEPDIGRIAFFNGRFPQQQHIGTMVGLTGLAVARHATLGSAAEALTEHVFAFFKHRHNPVRDHLADVAALACMRRRQ